MLGGGTYEVGGTGTGFVAMLESTGLFESSGARAERHGGTVSVAEPYYIARESVSTEAFCAFLNDVSRSSGPGVAAEYVVLSEYGNVVHRDGMYTPRESEHSSPVNCASFAGAVAYCDAYSVEEDFVPRLPTESEWIVAEQRFQFPVEHSARGEQFEVGNWTRDYYTDSMRTITTEPDSSGPAESGFVVEGVPSRVVRFPVNAVHDRRTWGFEGTDPDQRGQGFRVVITLEEPFRSMFRRMSQE